MDTKHTPGPWSLRLSDNATPYITHGKCAHGYEPDLNDLANRICVMPAEISTSYNSYANARLIAAAPELLAVLRDARASVQENRDSLYESHYQPHTGDVDAAGRVAVDVEDARLAKIDAAIAKATGTEA